MCLILFAYDCHPKYFLIMAANRDEFYNRATLPAHYWQENKNILAGRDLEKMGTWMGITKDGRFAALTNYRDPKALQKELKSRGELVCNFLLFDETPEDYLKKVKGIEDSYNGFNLLIGNKNKLMYYSKIEKEIKEVKPGIHGLSNHLLDTPWPKVTKGKKALEKYVSNNEIINPADLFRILADTSQAKINELPNTGVDLEWEKILSAIFIKSSTYGTRSSTILLIDRNNNVNFIERTFDKEPGKWVELNFQFKIL